VVVVTQQRGRTISGRTRRRGTQRFLGRVRRQAARGILGRIRLGTAGSSPRLRRWALAVVLLGVALMPYPTQGAAGPPPVAACRGGCRGYGSGSVPSMIRWTISLPGSWDVASGLTGTVPASGLAYASVGDGVAVVGVGLTLYGYSSKSGSLEWQNTLTGFPAGAAIVSVRTWPGEVTAGVSYRSAGGAGAPHRTEVVISDTAGVQTGRYPAAAFGGAVAGSAKYTVVVGATAVTSYDNATGRIRWQRPTGQVAQAWRTEGNWLYMAESDGGFVASSPVTALRRIDLATGAELVVRPLESLAFGGTLSTAFDGVVLFSSAAGVTAYSGTTGAWLWSIHGAVPESTDRRPGRIYLTEGSDLVGVDPLTGRVKATASGSAVNGSAGVYVVRDGVALGLDQGGNGDAWGYDLALQRVTLAAAGLPWPHYFVDLGDVGGSADPASDLVIIAACTKLAPGSLTQPTASAPAGSAPGSAASPSAGPSSPPPSSPPPSSPPPSSPPPSSPPPSSPPPSSPPPSSPPPSGSPSSGTSSTSGTPGSTGSPGSAGATPGPGAGPSPSPSSGVGQACLHPELVALNL
jgi:PQQ-like domain